MDFGVIRRTNYSQRNDSGKFYVPNKYLNIILNRFRVEYMTVDKVNYFVIQKTLNLVYYDRT